LKTDVNIPKGTYDQKNVEKKLSVGVGHLGSHCKKWQDPDP
jgi:hypothetical protein